MNKIVKSLSVIAFVAAIAIGATSAYFSDEEKSVGNTFTAGTIDIAIDGTNPWSTHYDIPDLKPGETGYINFNIQNVGQNPVNVSKNLSNFVGATGTVSEPECTDQGGYWTNPNGGCNWQSGTDLNNLETQITYDLSVKVYANGNDTTPIWWQEIYNANQDKTLAMVYPSETTYVALGMIPVGGHMVVAQSYHFSNDADNKYQGDQLSFDITIKGEQLPQGENGYASVVLDNKGGAPDWLINSSDSINGTLNYQATGDTFNYNFSANVNTANISYTLLYVGPSGNFPYSGEKLLGAAVASGTSLSLSGSVELSQDIVNGKIWLIPTSTYSSGWDNDNNLYETGLVNYNDINN